DQHRPRTVDEVPGCHPLPPPEQGVDLSDAVADQHTRNVLGAQYKKGTRGDPVFWWGPPTRASPGGVGQSHHARSGENVNRVEEIFFGKNIRPNRTIRGILPTLRGRPLTVRSQSGRA